YEVWFDYSNVVDHYPAPSKSDGLRSQFDECVYNNAFNHAYVLSKHSRGWRRVLRYLFLLFIGSRYSPGLVLWPLVALGPSREYRRVQIWIGLAGAYMRGWKTGAVTSASTRDHAEPLKTASKGLP